MLEIKKVTKIYETGSFKQKALDNVSVSFRESEFAAILGPSGSGKTTFLNIIGGLDKYDSGDLIINGVSTKKFKDSDWDSYRNHRVGFVFQSYNLISHQSVLSNVKLALTLSGISKKEATKRAEKALKDVGLEKHIYKKPNELSGGQMQRVAIARALVNDPDILLADEPTGALDSDTSVQIMELLKKIAKKKLVIMVTHNPDLAKEYANRIITLKDGEITSDSNPFKEKEVKSSAKDKKTSMSFLTALNLSFNNLMTKKGRTILVSLAGSIGIIGIALILALSTGFQNYIDSIQEETLTSYPLSIMQESSDITGTLLSLAGNHKRTGGNTVKEEQYITTMLGSISSNDLKSFKKYLNDNYKKVDEDISTVKYTYSVTPYIYTIDAKNNLSKINPSNLFTSMYGSSSIMSSYSSFSSIFNQMMDNRNILNEQYDVLEGRWPDAYDEIIIVLNEPNSISDLLVYSLGLRDTKELTEMVTKIMSGETVDIKNEPMTFTYEDLMNVDLRVIKATDTYKYNTKYDIYEDMSEDESYMNNLYKNALKLKIVGIVSPKEGTNSMALSNGVGYTKELTEYLINSAKETSMVKKQLLNDNVDIFSGKRFDNDDNKLNFDLKNIISVDSKKLEDAFNIKIDEQAIANDTQKYMNDISNSITTDTTKATKDFLDTFNLLKNELISNYDGKININEVDNTIKEYLKSESALNKISNLQKKYYIPVNVFSSIYENLLNGLINTYISVSQENNGFVNINESVLDNIYTNYTSSAMFSGVISSISSSMTEALMKKEILTKVGELTSNLSSKFASAFNVDQSKIASAFKLNLSEEELRRIITAMTSKKETNAKTNLINLGYQDLDEPTIISFYFNSFDGKEHFIDFLDNYNNSVVEEKKINYTDTTGILMSSVKTIVNAVSYVLIAFVSISLVVSSIMIGIITYISVYERTKEIGILRAIGASKRNISSIFNAETFIIGLLSGLFGIIITYILIPIINAVIHHFTGNIPLSAILHFKAALLLIVLSIILTLIGGLIPAKKASKKDPVIALRTE